MTVVGATSLPPKLVRRDALLRLAAFAFLTLMLVGSLALSFVVTPEDIEAGRVFVAPTCSFKRLTGHPCLGCGLTRGFAAFSHGRVADGLGYNVLTPLFYAGFWVGGALSALATLRALRDLSASRSLPDPKR